MSASAPARHVDLPNLGRVCRLGLATRGNGDLSPDAVLNAIDQGINYLNWCGHMDGMRDAIRSLGARRREVVIAIQLEARRAEDARRELDGILSDLDTDYLDVVTYYYVEHEDEWQTITGRGGAAEAMEQARREGTVRAIGLTSHQRKLAAPAAASGRLDLLMVRYNAAHRGADRDVFPVTIAHEVPVVAFTCLRWGALIEPTPDDPPHFAPPRAPQWYRWVLCQPAVSVALMAPGDATQLAENLEILQDWRGLDRHDYDALAEHGDRVRRHAPAFP